MATETGALKPRMAANKAGFVIVGMFIFSWAAAMLIWRYGHIEQKWSARLQRGQQDAADPTS
jgi:hypothetical protein